MNARPDNPERPAGNRKRRLRAAFSADVANFSGRVSVSETRAFGHLTDILKIGREELDRFEGNLIGMPGDGLFALFESAVDAVQCALAIQSRLTVHQNLGGMRLRIGIHLGDVLFDGDLPFGETLNIAARLQALADPGGTLVSGAIVDAVSARVAATFEDRGVPQMKNIPRRIATFAIHPQTGQTSAEPGEAPAFEPLDRTMQLPRRASSSDRPAPTVVAQPETQPQPQRPNGPATVEQVARMVPQAVKPSVLANRPPVEEAEVSIAPIGQAPAPLPPAPPPVVLPPAAVPMSTHTAPTTEVEPPGSLSARLARVAAVEPPRPAPPPPPPVAPPVTPPLAAALMSPPAEPVAVPPPAPLTSRAPPGPLERLPTPETIAIVAEALAVHLGPVARVMTARKAKDAPTLSVLIAALEQQVPTPAEQHAFRSRVMRQFSG